MQVEYQKDAKYTSYKNQFPDKKPSVRLAALVSQRHPATGRMSPRDLKFRQTLQSVPAALSVRNRVSMEVASPSMLDPDLDGYANNPKVGQN